MFKTILHPTDLSDCSEYAFRIARQLAAAQDSRLIVLHAVETLGPENVTYGETAAPQPQEYRTRLQADFERYLAQVATKLALDPVIVEGDPSDAIVDTARNRQCDLIVMGTHGRKGLSRLLTGSVAEEVVRRAPCPVLIARLPTADES